MKNENALLRLMNIRGDEARAVFMLIAFSFFTGLTLSFYFTASNALFLKHFDSRMIPVSFIASGVLIYLSWLVFSRLDARMNFKNQVSLKMLFVFITVALLTAGVYYLPSSWLIFILYTWVRVVVFVTLVTFWGIAGRLFNLRQGKRIFGLITTGEVVSIIIGYFSIPLLLRFLKAPDLLLLASVTLLLCLVMARWILLSFSALMGSNTHNANTALKEAKTNTSYLKLIRKPYFSLISLMALMPIFGYLFVDFLFLSQTKVEFAQKPEAIAGFFGVFLGSVAVIELLMKLVSGRFLNKYGIRPSLLSLPVVMVGSVLVAAIAGLLYGASTLFFAFIALSRLFERSVRAAVYEPSFQLLYQPVPADQRLVFQNQIEGIPKALGTILTGLVILFFSAFGSLGLVFYSWFFVLALLVWVWISFRMYDSYRGILKSKLHELDNSQPEKISLESMMFRALSQCDPANFMMLVLRCEAIDPPLTARVLINVFNTSNDEIRLLILQHQAGMLHFGTLPLLYELKKKSSAPAVEAAVAHSISVLEEGRAASVDTIATMAASDLPAQRVRAARMLGASARYQSIRLLLSLAADADPEVKKAAIISCGKLKRMELFPVVTGHLSKPAFAAVAERAALLIGEPVLNPLFKLFEKSGRHPLLQLRIIGLIARIPGENAAKWLRSALKITGSDLQRQIVVALSRRNHRAQGGEISLFNELIAVAVENIIRNLASIRDLEKNPHSANLRLALMTEMDEEKEAVFSLLTLLYEPATIRHIRDFIESSDGNARVYALEIGEMTLSREMRQLVFPVFEDLGVNEKLARFAERFPQEKLTVEERLCEMINRPYSLSERYIKASALLLFTNLDRADEKSVQLLAANILHPDPLIAEAAALSFEQLNPKAFAAKCNALANGGYPNAQWLPQLIDDYHNKQKLLLINKIELLKNNSLFATLAENKIANMLSFYTDIRFVNVADAPHSSENSADHLQIRVSDFTVSLPISCLTENMVKEAGLQEKLFSLTVLNQ